RVDLAVYGNRRWERMAWGGWMQSEPEPFDGIPLSWSRAYGGTVRLAPGFLPGSEVPHPGGEGAYPQNPEGMGVILTEDDAHGAPRPNPDEPAALLKKPPQRPVPARR